MERRIQAISVKLQKLIDAHNKLKEKQKQLLDSLQQTHKMLIGEDNFSNYSPSKGEQVRLKLLYVIDEQYSSNNLYHSKIDNIIQQREMQFISGNINKDNVRDVEQEIKRAYYDFQDYTWYYDGWQMYVDELFEKIGILPSK